jgi:hypothetical protein
MNGENVYVFLAGLRWNQQKGKNGLYYAAKI